MRLWGLALVVPLLAVGCGSGGDPGAPDASIQPVTAPDAGVATFAPAPHPPPPQVVNLGGPVLAAPKLVPVFFANEDPATRASVLDFLARLGASGYWQATTAEYGVGAPSVAPAVQLAETATGTLSDTDVAAWLAGKLNGNDPAFPPPDPSTLYLLHYPPGVVITAQDVQMNVIQSCHDIGGFHTDLALDAAHHNAHVAYAVLPRCAQFNGQQGVDALTSAESHEIVEGATDPYPVLAPAFSLVDDAHLVWAVALGGVETADLCTNDPQADQRFGDLPYIVQRSWSNQSANAGHDPCVPTLPGEVYFNAVPEEDDTITMSVNGQAIATKGVHVSVGDTRTIPLALFSEAPTSGPWNVIVRDFSQLVGGPQLLQLSLDRQTGQNGDRLQLTIHVLQAGAMNVEPFLVASELNGAVHLWVGAVGR